MHVVRKRHPSAHGIQVPAVKTVYMYVIRTQKLTWLIHVTVPEKTDHSMQMSDVEILVAHCSVLFTLLCNGEVRMKQA